MHSYSFGFAQFMWSGNAGELCYASMDCLTLPQQNTITPLRALSYNQTFSVQESICCEQKPT